MSPEHEFTTFVVAFFRAMSFGPLIVVGVVIVIASWLKILDALSWLLHNLHEYRARRSAEIVLAPNLESGIVEDHVVEDHVVENGMIE